MYMYTVEQLYIYVGVYIHLKVNGEGVISKIYVVKIEDLIKNKDWFDNVYRESCQICMCVNL